MEDEESEKKGESKIAVADPNKSANENEEDKHVLEDGSDEEGTVMGGKMEEFDQYVSEIDSSWQYPMYIMQYQMYF